MTSKNLARLAVAVREARRRSLVSPQGHAGRLGVQVRLAELLTIHNRLSLSAFMKRLGQTLEIAVYRALAELLPFHTPADKLNTLKSGR